MKNLICCLTFLNYCIFYVISAKILVLHVHDERSHLLSMTPFLKKLSEEGHNITIFDSGSHENPAVFLGFNSTVIYKYMAPNAEYEEGLSRLWEADAHSSIIAYVHKIADENMGRLILDSAESFVEILKTDYDLVIVDEIFSIHGMTIAKVLKELKGIPYIIFTTGNCEMESNLGAAALGHTPIMDATMGTLMPEGHGDIYDSRRFRLRLHNVLQAMAEFAVLHIFNPLIATYENPSKLMAFPFSTYDINQHMEMNLREGLDRLGRIVPQAVDYRGIGSHCKAVPKLPQELADFVEDPNSKGTIYIAFGSLVNFDQCPKFIFDAIFEAINQFSDYRIIFSIKKPKSRTLPSLNDHVKLISWAPQLAILGHKKTALFMSHGGLKSFKESLCTKTPIVFLPVLAEQGAIARMSMKMGIGTALNKFTVSSDKIVEAFNLILQNDSFKKNMEKTNNFYLDRIMPSLDEGAWFIKKVVERNQRTSKNPEKSSLFFRRNGISMGFLSYYTIEWFLFIAFLCYFFSS